MIERPVRVQRKRVKGWRKPPNTVIVDRTTNWGNPYERNHPETTNDVLVGLFRDYVRSGDAAYITTNIAELRGKNLACWCALDQPCHADVLLELANDPTTLRARGK